MDVNMSKSTKNRDKNKDAGLAKQLMAGTSKHFAGAPSMAFGSATFTPAEVTQRLQTTVTLRAAVIDAQAAVKAKLATEDAQAPAQRGFISDLSSFVKTTFSKSPDVLADFGLAPRKANKPLTAQEQNAAVAKRAATRAARHTMGKVQKQAVTGDVVDVVVTPVIAQKPVVSAPAASPPPGAASGGATPHGA
jgi:hypothetical protein